MEAAKHRLLKGLRDSILDYMEEGGNPREAHEAVSVVKGELNDTLRWQTEQTLILPFSG